MKRLKHLNRNVIGDHGLLDVGIAVASKLETGGRRELPSIHIGAGVGLPFLLRCLWPVIVHAMAEMPQGGWERGGGWSATRRRRKRVVGLGSHAARDGVCGEEDGNS